VVKKTTQQDISNVFAPLELDLTYKGPDVTVNPDHPLLMTWVGSHNYQPMLGMRGIELREGSGERGYFEMHVIRCNEDRTFGWDEDRTFGWGNAAIGLATHDVRLHHRLGVTDNGCGWYSRGLTVSQTLRGFSEFKSACRLVNLKFRTGDMVGIMVDCREVPTVCLFMNGVQVCHVVVAQEGYGQVVYPAFCLHIAQIEIASNSDLPIL